MPDCPNKLSQFWQELKRRKVVRVITVYAAAAFVILELVSIIVEPLKLPEWLMPVVIVLLCVGFIIAVILSWIYDVKPEGGIVKTKPVHKVKEEDKVASSNSWKIASYISFVVIIALIVLNIIPRTNRSDIKEILDKSIAVLPFKNDSPDQEMYFINGTMEEILDNLCKIKDLRVISRNSVEQYRNNPKPTPVIAEEMKVSYVLEGSGQRDGNNIRFTVQLLDAKNDSHVWSESYYRELKNIFELQSEIAQSIASEIKAIVTPEEKQLIEKIPTTNLTAYDFYQRGEEERRKYSSDDSLALERAEDLYQHALEEDSTFALAYIGLANVYWSKHYWETYFQEDFMDSVQVLADIALSYDDQLAEAFALKGNYYHAIDDTEQAINELDKAIKYNPNDGRAYRRKAWIYSEIDPAKAIDNFHKTASLSRGPEELPSLLRNLSMSLKYAGFMVESNDYDLKALKLDGDLVAHYNQLIWSAYCLGNYEDAIDPLEKLYLIDSNDTYVNFFLGGVYIWLGQYEKSLMHFENYIEKSKALNFYNISNGHWIGLAYWQNGYKEKAEYYFDQHISYCNRVNKLGRNLANTLFTYLTLAEVYAFRGEKEEAFENLRIYNQRETHILQHLTHIKNDPFFNSIRNEPEFQQIVSDVEAKYQVEHDKVRQWLEENEML